MKQKMVTFLDHMYSQVCECFHGDNFVTLLVFTSFMDLSSQDEIDV